MTVAEWIAVDWGTTHLRAWAMHGREVLDHKQSNDGMGGLDRSGFEPALLRLVDEWLGAGTTEVVACGMVGARQGWVEAPYQTVPCSPLGTAPVPVVRGSPRLAAFVIPGLRQLSPPDVMRGEETQIAGFLALNPNWDGVICLPGTHTKWAQISAGEVVSFQTFMTGEMFAALSTGSVLRHSVSEEGWNEGAFTEALEDTLSKPERLAARLFTLRARDLLEAQPRDVARARLSGLLLGAELAAARPYWLGQQIALVGSSQTTAPYAAALENQGVPTTIADGTAMTLSGLTQARRSLKEPA